VLSYLALISIQGQSIPHEIEYRTLRFVLSISSLGTMDPEIFRTPAWFYLAWYIIGREAIKR
jgi:hypothetical protein